MNRPSTFDPVDEMGSARDLRSDADAKTRGFRYPAYILAAAADRIEPDGRWAQLPNETFSARDEAGEPCPHSSRRAASFCVLGAVDSIGWSPEAVAALGEVVRALGFESVVRWNDAEGRTQAEVVAALRAAALLADGALERQSPDDGPGNVLNEKEAAQ